jgi:type VI protein secretion system component VasF
MVAIDATFDRLKAIEAAGFTTPPDRPDLDPAHEALQLAEHYREAARLADSRDRGAAFVDSLTKAESVAQSLRAALRALADQPSNSSLRNATSTALQAAAKDCKACHSRFRDESDPSSR